MDDFIPEAGVPDEIVDAGPTQSEPAHEGLPSLRRAIVWGVAIVVFAAFASVVKVHTYLGVKASIFDKDGNDHVWSVWWRARHQMLNAAPSTLFVVIYIGLIALFLVFSVLALWLALVPGNESAGSEIAGTLTADGQSVTLQ